MRSFLLACSVSLLVGCARVSREWYSLETSGRHVEPAEWQSRCPHGHQELDVIPVEYGLIIPAPDRHDFKNLTYWPGGCAQIIGYSADDVQLCRACGYKFDPMDNGWDRQSERADGFEPALDSAILSFVLPERGTITYRSYGRVVERGRIRKENLWFTTSEAATVVRERIERHLNAPERGPDVETVRGGESDHEANFVSFSPRGRMEATVRTYADDNRTVISLTYFYPLPTTE